MGCCVTVGDQDDRCAGVFHRPISSSPGTRRRDISYNVLERRGSRRRVFDQISLGKVKMDQLIQLTRMALFQAPQIVPLLPLRELDRLTRSRDRAAPGGYSFGDLKLSHPRTLARIEVSRQTFPTMLPLSTLPTFHSRRPPLHRKLNRPFGFHSLQH